MFYNAFFFLLESNDTVWSDDSPVTYTNWLQDNYVTMYCAAVDIFMNWYKKDFISECLMSVNAYICKSPGGR